jgi:hypothetical protein
MSEEATTPEGEGRAAPPAEKKAGGGIRRILVYGALVAALAGGGWFVNDSSAVDLVNKNRESLMVTSKNLSGLANGSMTGEEDAKVSAHIEKQRQALQSVIDTEGGKGPLDFLTRGAVKEGARRNHLTAAVLMPIFTLLKGDVEQAKKDLAVYEAVKKSSGIAVPEGMTEMIDRVSKLLGDPETAKLDPEMLRKAILWGMQAGK